MAGSVEAEAWKRVPQGLKPSLAPVYGTAEAVPFVQGSDSRKLKCENYPESRSKTNIRSEKIVQRLRRSLHLVARAKATEPIAHYAPALFR